MSIDNSNFVNLVHKVINDMKLEVKADFKSIEERLGKGVSTFTEHTTEIRYIKEDINKLDKKADGIITEQGAMRATLEDRINKVETKLAMGRPNWLIVAIIMALLSIIGGLWTAIIRGAGGV